MSLLTSSLRYHPGTGHTYVGTSAPRRPSRARLHVGGAVVTRDEALWRVLFGDAPWHPLRLYDPCLAERPGLTGLRVQWPPHDRWVVRVRPGVGLVTPAVGLPALTRPVTVSPAGVLVSHPGTSRTVSVAGRRASRAEVTAAAWAGLHPLTPVWATSEAPSEGLCRVWLVDEPEHCGTFVWHHAHPGRRLPDGRADMSSGFVRVSGDWRYEPVAGDFMPRPSSREGGYQEQLRNRVLRLL